MTTGTKCRQLGAPTARAVNVMSGAAVIVMIALYHAVACAGELGVLVNGKAIHLERKEGTTYNEKNWGTGLQYNFDTLPSGWKPFAQLSGFVDSNRNNSYYISGGFVHKVDALSTQNGGLTTSAGAAALVMRRHRLEGMTTIGGAVPAVVFGTRYVDFNVTYVPRHVPKSVSLVFIHAVIPIGRCDKTC